jgi:hypothetical protein
MNRFRLVIAAAFATYLAICLSACATLPAKSPIEQYVDALERCERQGPCVLLEIINGQPQDAVDVFVNGTRVTQLEIEGEATIWFPVSRLTDGLCAHAVFRLRTTRYAYRSDRQCLSEPDGHFTIRIDGNLNVWLSPWRKGQRA